MIKLRAFIERTRSKPGIGTIVLLLLVVLLVLVALHPAIDVLEIAAACLTFAAIGIGFLCLLDLKGSPRSRGPSRLLRARPPTLARSSAGATTPVPLRL